MIDEQAIGRSVSRYRVDVDKGKLRFFARVIGETDPVYGVEAQQGSDVAAVPLPSTHRFCLEMESADRMPGASVGLELPKVFLGEHSLHY